MMDTFPERLRTARENANLSQGEIARRLGIRRQTVTNWENGLARPRTRTLQRLTEILGTSTAYLLGEIDDPRRPTPDETGGRDPIREVAKALKDAGATEDDIDTVTRLLTLRKRLREKIAQLEKETK